MQCRQLWPGQGGDKILNLVDALTLDVRSFNQIPTTVSIRDGKRNFVEINPHVRIKLIPVCSSQGTGGIYDTHN